MTQQTETSAVGGETAPVESTDPTAVFEQIAREEFGITDEEEQPAEGEQAEPDSTEEAEDETRPEEEADDLPPIDAPVSWDAEAKETFKALPREAQEIVAKREAEREKFVQSKSQEAAQAKQTALSEANAQLAQVQQTLAQQYAQLAEQIMPQRPNPAMLQTDPMAFYAQQAQYEQAAAQQRELQQLSAQHAHEAQLRASQLEHQTQAEQHRIIVENFPEYADPTTGPELQRKLTAVAKRLGYSDELIGQARASDILAMRQAADAFDKADKWDALQKTKMQKVREAKGKPPVSARPGSALTPGQSAQRNEAQLMDTLLNSKNRDVQGEAFAALLQQRGLI